MPNEHILMIFGDASLNLQKSYYKYHISASLQFLFENILQWLNDANQLTEKSKLFIVLSNSHCCWVGTMKTHTGAHLHIAKGISRVTRLGL